MLLSAVSVLVVAHSSSEVPEGLMNNPVYLMGKTCSLLPKVLTKSKICMLLHDMVYFIITSERYAITLQEMGYSKILLN